MASKNLKETIYLKTVLDTSDTLKKAKQLKQQLSSQGADSKSIGRVDKQIVQLEETYSKLQAAAKSGFSNNAEVTQYLNLLSKVNLKVHEIISSLDEASSTTFTINTKDAEKKLNDLKKKAESIQSDILKASRQSAKSLGLSDTQTESLLSAVKTGDANKVQKVYEDIKNAAADAVKEQEKVVAAAKEAVAGESFKKAKESALKNKGALRENEAGISVLGQYVKAGKAYKNFDPERTRIKNSETGRYTQKISAEGYALVDKTYKEMLTSLDTLDISSKQVFDRLQDELKEKFNFELEESDKLLNTINRDLKRLSQVSIDDTNVSNNPNVKKQTSELEKRKGHSQTLESQSADIFISQANAIQTSQEKVTNGEQEYRKKIEETKAAYEKYIQELKEVIKGYEESHDAAKKDAEGTSELAKRQEELANSFENVKSYISSYLTLGAALREVRQIINQTWQDSKNLDQAFASIAMVTDYSVEEMWQSYDQYSQMAQQLGQRTEDVIKSSALFYQ